jgi:DNA-binding phage protein
MIRRRALTADAQVICARLRTEIIRTGWSETARRSGVERAALHRAFMGGGKRVPSFQTIASVAQALGLEFSLQRRAK